MDNKTREQVIANEDRLIDEINKQAKVIQWYEKENRHNQEIIIKDTKEIERLNNIITELEKALKDELFEIDFFTQDKYVEAVRNTCNKYLDLLKELKENNV